MKIYVERREIRGPLAPMVAYYIVDEEGRTISQPYPNARIAKEEMHILADSHSGVEPQKGKRE